MSFLINFICFCCFLKERKKEKLKERKKMLTSSICSKRISKLFSYSSRHGSVLSFKDLSFEYKQNQPLLEKVSFSIEEGSKVTIMGQNGSGILRTSSFFFFLCLSYSFLFC